MRKRWDQKALIFYSLAVLLFLALSFGSGITRIFGFTLFPDEFGYWASAAPAAGYDWSGVTAYGSYYSFGYSLILTPILWLSPNALWAYRIALGMNTLLLAAAFILLQRIVGRLIPRSALASRILSAGIAVCYPTWLLYRNMTMTEVLLVFCFLLVCELLMRYLEQPTAGRFTAAGVSAVYLYTVHMRSVPVLCACVGCMLLFWIWETGKRRRENAQLPAGRVCSKKEECVSGEYAHTKAETCALQGRAYPGKEECASGEYAHTKAETCALQGRACPKKRDRIPSWAKLLAALVIVGAAYLLAERLKELTQASVYAKSDGARLSVNDYGGQLSKIKDIFTWRGFRELIVSLIGKVYYLSFASFGLFFAGVWFLCKKMTEKDSDGRVRIACLFLLLSTAGEILVCAVYTKGYGRIDGLCYGRYDELILPALMAFGCFGVLAMKRPPVYGLTVILSGIPITAMLETIIKNHQLTNINGGYFIAGLSYLLRYIPFEPERYFWKAYALAAVLCGIMLIILMLIRRQNALRWLLLVWIGVEVLLGMSLNESMVYAQNRVRYRDMRMVAAIEELQGACDAGEERRIVCFGGADTGSYAAVIQFRLREETIYFFRPEDANQLRERDLVLVCEKEDRSIPEADYTEHEVYGIFHLYYNE